MSCCWLSLHWPGDVVVAVVVVVVVAVSVVVAAAVAVAVVAVVVCVIDVVTLADTGCPRAAWSHRITNSRS